MGLKVLVCITKVAEVEVDLDEARQTLLDDEGLDTTGWPDQEICETFISHWDDDPEFSTYVTIVTQLEDEEIMTKLEQLREAAAAIPEQYNIPRAVCMNLVEQGNLPELRTYSLGLRDMAIIASSNQDVIDALTTVRSLLK